MGNLYLGNQKSALNKGFMEIGVRELVFPPVALSVESTCFFGPHYDGTARENFFNSEEDFAFLGSYEDSYKVFDKDDTVSMANTNMWIKFKNPVAIKAFRAKIGSTEWGLYATNDEGLFRESILYNQANEKYGTPLIASGENCGEEMTTFPVNEEGVAYQYYIFGTMYTWSDVYEIALVA